MEYNVDDDFDMIDFEDDERQLFNIDGTPMLNEYVDMRGCLYGCTTSSFDESISNNNEFDDHVFDNSDNDCFMDMCSITDSYSSDAFCCCSDSLYDSFSSSIVFSPFDSCSGFGADSISWNSFDW